MGVADLLGVKDDILELGGLGVTLDLLDGCQDEEVHGEDEELERHGDLVNTIGPQVHGQSEGRVRGLKQGDGDDGGGVGDGSEASQQLLPALGQH